MNGQSELLHQSSSYLIFYSPVKHLANRLVWTLEKEEIQSMLTAIERFKSSVCIALKADDTVAFEEIRADTLYIINKVGSILQHSLDIADLVDKVDELGLTAGRLETALESQEQRKKDTEIQKILDWLCPLDFRSHYSNAQQTLVEGTGSWFLRHPVFQKWSLSDRAMLFGVGIPGAGKTLISTIVINELKRTTKETNGVILYAFCNFQDRMQHTTTGFLGGLLRQIATNSPKLRDLSDKLQQERSQLSESDIRQLIQDEIMDSRQVYIIVDALDEFGTHDGDKRALLNEICWLRRYANVFVTSRFDTLENELRSIEGLLKIDIEAQEEDLEIWITKHMPDLPPHVRKSTELQEQIRVKILGSVRGM